MKLCPRDPSHGLMFQREDETGTATATAGGLENALGWAGSGLGTTLHFQDLTPDSPGGVSGRARGESVGNDARRTTKFARKSPLHGRFRSWCRSR